MDFWSIMGGFSALNLLFFRYFSASFLSLIFKSIFLWFFIGFRPLETLKIVLPPTREHNFYKIGVLGFIAKFGPKIDGFWIPKSTQNQKK